MSVIQHVSSNGQSSVTEASRATLWQGNMVILWIFFVTVIG